ncbi:MAG: hypothetical protein HQK51_09480 [Oligoflexia bacterium]|nr:hypothetical protein [Oligoflexia bacterium]
MQNNYSYYNLNDLNNDNAEKNFFISCNRKCEEVLIKELKALGFINQNPDEKAFAGVHFTGNMEDAFKIILNSRVASRVYLKLANFEIKLKKDQEKELLYQTVRQINWCEIFSAKESIKVSCILGRGLDKRLNSHYLSQIAKDAVVDTFRDNVGQRPNVNTAFPDIPIVLYFENNNVDILIDISGEPLGNRHYRQNDFAAPLRENLAASILYLSEWNYQNECFIDCMCGSGTMTIEALLMGLNIPPSFIKVKRALINDSAERLKHRWTIENLKFFKENAKFRMKFKELLKSVREQYKLNNKISIFASDISAKSLTTTKTHISFIERELSVKLANDVIFIKKADATTLKLPSLNKNQNKGIIFANPPYGKRLGAELETDYTDERDKRDNNTDDNDDQLAKLYHDLGENFKQNFKDFRAYIFTGNLELRKKISLQTSSRIELFNGDIECRLLRYNLY